jgi:serine/threonine protein kinase
LGLRGNELDGRTDLYSLGLVLFEMLTAVRPFAADTFVATLLLRVQNDPVAPRQLRPEIPQVVSDLVMRAVAREREARYGSAEEMQRAIEGVLDRFRSEREFPKQGASSLMDVPRLMDVPAPKNKRKNARSVIAGLVAAVGAVTLAGWFFWPRPNPAPEPVKPPSVTPQQQVDHGVPGPKGLPVLKEASGTEKPKIKVQDEKKADAPLKTTKAAVIPAPPKPSSAGEGAMAVGNTGEVKVNPKDGLKYELAT